MDIDEKLKKLVERDFYNIYDIVYEKLCSNKEFKKIRNDIHKVLKDYPKVSDVCLEGKSINLSKTETRALIKYLKCKREENELYDEQLLYMGVKLAYIIFKKADMLKEEK